MLMQVDGKQIANDILETFLAERKNLPPVLRLGVLMGAQDAASASFVKIKERVADKLRVVVVREELPNDATTPHALRVLERLAKNCAGVIVQLPLPQSVDTEVLLGALPAEKDVDGVSPKPLVRAPVAEAISEILARNGVAAANKTAAVVGAGRLVGIPAAALLKELGAEVTVITRNEGNLMSLKHADIVILGAGEPGLVKPEMLKEGVVLIDAGTSAPGKLVTASSGIPPRAVTGDADPRCAEVASVFTPVPGGVGPIAVAMIFKNLFALSKIQNK
ncbi:MAG: bifunctional 5,10-methylenetetrahydrofolate dehydrogenase/5,10-methenyltetrahydrofolate cyclohydrolase [Patescibacteria group bacterium]